MQKMTVQGPKRWLIVGGILLAVAVAASALWYGRPNQSPTDVPVVQAEPLVPPVPTFVHGVLANDLTVIENTIQRNQRFADLFQGYALNPRTAQQLNMLPKSVYDFRKIAAHKKYTLLVENDSARTARALIYEPNAIDYVIFHLKDSLLVETCQREVKRIEKNVAGVVYSNLSETVEAMGISHELTNRFVDIFGWQVDFQRLQRGDRFKLIYDELQVDGQPIGIGGIKGIYFEHMGQGMYAFPFDQGEGTDYFDEDGKSLRKALLKYPIEFTRISSRYSMSRFHPVAKVFRPHLGTDFAAPTGTPIRSVGDGMVEEAQFKINNGNYVKVRHNATYTTAYLHMSKIGSGIVPGVRVRQGQVIGYVGSTGLATGPHLCYRFFRNGVQVDALKVELPPSQPVKSEFAEAYALVKTYLTQQLQQIPFPEVQEEVVIAGN
ncbi:MAG: peptidoglycan DD-metalloendopeptidase family protein [Cyclobacteriaceae bacterium]|jgi:murein DD-endopeptidase MepM/ murein hydrolase activator NlpD|nr:peptidoglycan DD-metalloendopeptidase family protein [Cyclobacteriaceae bacterium]